jgi:uncharacterized damage-inducible protein DinB
MAREAPHIGGTEKDVMWGILDRNRDVMTWKLEGLSEEDARRPMVSSGTNLLGLVKHLAAVEYGWFCLTFGRDTEPLPFDDDDPDADLKPTDDETIASISAFYERAREAADAAIEDLDMDDTGPAWGRGPERSLRWVLAHMIEETARHAGHADILREQLDETTGYFPDN